MKTVQKQTDDKHLTRGCVFKNFHFTLHLTFGITCCFSILLIRNIERHLRTKVQGGGGGAVQQILNSRDIDDIKWWCKDMNFIFKW